MSLAPVHPDFNRLLNEAIQMAKGRLENQGEILPFGLGIRRSGDLATILPADANEKDPKVLGDSIRTILKDPRSSWDYRCLALTQRVLVQKDDGTARAEIQITIDHPVGDDAVTCYLPFSIEKPGRVALGEIYATDAVERLYWNEPLPPPRPTIQL